MNNKPCGIIIFAKFIHPKAKNIMKISRTVILPEFQGFGIAGIVTDILAKYYKDLNYRVRSTTSHPARIAFYKKNKNWICCQQGRMVNKSKTGLRIGGSSSNRFTTSWEYVGEK